MRGFLTFDRPDGSRFDAAGAGRAVRWALSLLVASILALAPSSAHAQFPGEVHGSVIAEADGAPVGGALVEITELGRSVVTEASGVFHLRGLEPGRYRIQVQHLGYSSWSDEIEIENGRVTQLRAVLIEDPVTLEALEVEARRRPRTGVRLDRAEIERAGARTVGELVRRAPGVVLREEGTGGQQTVSIRGSGADAVLVLLDGVPLNDPVSGVADLSTISVETIESITVLVGAQGARYGPRAEAGAVLIETRSASAGLESRLAAGSFGEWDVGAEAGTTTKGVEWTLGGSLRRSDGRFDYSRVSGVDETKVRRVNVDLAEHSIFGVARAELAGGELRGRVGAESLRRGIPGKGYAPSREARQELDRVRGSVGWRRDAGSVSSTVALAAIAQELGYADPAPPFGLAYDDTTRAGSLELRGEVERLGKGRWMRRHGVGLEVARQFVSAGSLGDHAPRYRTDLGVFTHVAAGRELEGWDAEFVLELRGDRDVGRERWYLNRAVGLHLTTGNLALHLSNRSGYSPPTLGDQFFREGVAVEPNPDLEAERIPSEWELGTTLTGRIGLPGLALSGEPVGTLGLRLYQGDVRGMIVWLPDFRFVWSPRNIDIKRHGLELWTELQASSGLRLAGSYTAAVATYDRSAGDDTVQVAYRPRHTAQLDAGWEGERWRAGVGVLYTGTRYPGPAKLNALDPFWTFRLDLGREWYVGSAEVMTTLQIDRPFDEKGALIFGFPEAGRRLRIEARVRRSAAEG